MSPTRSTESEPLNEQILIAVDVTFPPTPDEIDQAVENFHRANAEAARHKEASDIIKARLIFLVNSFGQVPPQAAQSKRLVGRHSEATITFGTTLAVNEEGVAHFEDYLRAHGYFDLFLRFFAAETKHRVVEGARDVVKTLTLPKRIEEKIHQLFGRAIEVKTKAPSLAVKTIQPEKPARKPRGGKAAA